jgi:hypothetical protein
VKIYRFDISSEVGRCGGNVLYEARDPVDSSTVHLYEWNPPFAEWTMAPEALATVAPELVGVEAFSGTSRLYVAGSPEHARAAIETLRRRQLFLGAWPGLSGDDGEPAAPSAGQPVAGELGGDAPQAGGRRPSTGDSAETSRALAWIFAVLALILGIYAVRVRGARAEAVAESAEREERIETIAAERDSLQQQSAATQVQKDLQITALDGDRQRLQQERDGFQQQLAEQQRRWDSVMEPMPVRDVYFANRCSYQVRVAVRYLRDDGTWGAIGWWIIDGQRVEPMETTAGPLRARLLYYYAEREVYPHGRVSQGADIQFNYGGKVLPMMAAPVVADGKFRLACD